MSAQGFIQATRASTQDQIITVQEMQTILRQAEADGVITDGEKRALRTLLATNTNTLTEEARRHLTTFLERYSAGGDTSVTNTTAALDLVRRNFNLIAAGRSELTRADLQTIIDSPAASEQLKTAARHLLNHFNEYSNMAGLRPARDAAHNPAADGRISIRDLQVGGRYSELNAQRAYEIIRDNWNYLDTSGNTIRNGYITRDSLRGALSDPNTSEELKAAARFLLAQPAMFDRLDGAYDGRRDGWIRLADVNTAISRESMSARNAVEAVIAEFNEIDRITGALWWRGRNGQITREELQHFIRHTPSNSRLAAAAQMIVNNPDLFDQLSGGRGSFSVDDLRRWMAGAGQARLPDLNPEDLAPASAPAIAAGSLPQTREQQHAALHLVATNYGVIDRDGNGIDRAELETIVRAPGASEQLRAAAQYLLNDFANVATGGRISQDALQLAVERAALTGTRAFEILRRNSAALGGEDGFTRADLERVAADPHGDRELRAAAGVLLRDRALFDRADNMAAGGRRDGRITPADLDAAIVAGDMTDARALELLAFNFAVLRAANGEPRAGGFNAQDLEAIAARSPDPELRAAALHASRSGLFDRVRRFALDRGRSNGLVSDDDLRAFLRSSAPAGTPGALPSGSAAVASSGSAAPTGSATGTAAGAQVQAGAQEPAQVPYTVAQARTINILDREIDNILTDPGLTVEDKVTYALMLIAKYMDKQIEDQLERLRQLQVAQQNQNRPAGTGTAAGARAGAGAGAGAAGQNNNSDTSIDVEAMRLKRLVDKRGQLFDTLRQIIDKYNQTAKAIIDTIGR